jgi:hypothetical protein
MDKAHPPARSHLFTVRLWREDLGQGQTEWRGEAHDVKSGEKRYFRDWPTLLTLVQAMLPPEGPGVPSRCPHQAPRRSKTRSRPLRWGLLPPPTSDRRSSSAWSSRAWQA